MGGVWAIHEGRYPHYDLLQHQGDKHLLEAYNALYRLNKIGLFLMPTTLFSKKESEMALNVIHRAYTTHARRCDWGDVTGTNLKPPNTYNAQAKNCS